MTHCGSLLRRVASALIAGLVASAGMTGLATVKEPTGEYALFNQCPRFASGVKQCLYARTYGGELKLGTRLIPLLQAGTYLDLVTGEEVVVGASNGETLSRSPQPLPGGLFGHALDVTMELADPPSAIGLSVGNLIGEAGTALSLPVKMHLESPFLGSECFIGSHTAPVVLNLTDGTTSPAPPNRPLRGSLGPATTNGEETILELAKSVLVGNTFSMPEATGCGGGGTSTLVDRLLDDDLGLPSPDGHNAAILDNTFYRGAVVAVVRSER